jgi:hypothetical protein
MKDVPFGTAEQAAEKVEERAGSGSAAIQRRVRC